MNFRADLAIEILRSRYIDRTVAGAPSFVASDLAFNPFRLGDFLSLRFMAR